MLRKVINGELKLSMAQSDMLFAVAIIVRSSALLFSAIAMRNLSPFNVLAVRFLLAFAILFVLFRKRFTQISKLTFVHGLAVGLSFFSCMTFEMFALKYAPSSKVAFLENLAMVFVPIIDAFLLRSLPKISAILSAIIAMAGVALLTLGESGSMTLSKGEIFAILAAFGFAVTIIITDRVTKNGDSFMIGVIQVGVIGVASLVCSIGFESFSLPSSVDQWGAIIYLALVATCIGFVIQPIAQSGTTSEHTGLISSLNPVVAAILGAIFLGERFGAKGILGAALILTAILIQNYLEKVSLKRTISKDDRI